MLIAETASAAFAADIAVCGAHIHHNFAAFGIAYDGALGHGNFQIVCRFAVELRVFAVIAVLRYEFSAVFEVQKGVYAFVNDESDVAAVASVASVGAAPCDIFFTVERNAAVTAVTGFYINFYVVDKHCVTSLCSSFQKTLLHR